MGVIDNSPVIKRFVRWIDGSECTESRADNRMIQKDVPGAVAHGSALVLANFKGLQTREAREDLLDAQPGNKGQRRDEHDAAGQKVLGASAVQENDGNQEKQFDAKTDDAAARSTQQKSANRNQREQTANTLRTTDSFV